MNFYHVAIADSNKGTNFIVMVWTKDKKSNAEIMVKAFCQFFRVYVEDIEYLRNTDNLYSLTATELADKFLEDGFIVSYPISLEATPDPMLNRNC